LPVPTLSSSALAVSRRLEADRSKIGLTDEERRGLEACPNVTLVDVADSGHMVMMDQPARTAELILELVSADAGALKTS
jgi:pimeloyl-ACP methyl ester carboxylesterase